MMKTKRMSCWIVSAITSSFIPAASGWIPPWTSPSQKPCFLNNVEINELGMSNDFEEIVGASTSKISSRRDILSAAAATTASLVGSASYAKYAEALGPESFDKKQQYSLKFPTLFAPLYGDSYRKTIKRSMGRSTVANSNITTAISNDNIWALEQNLELGPLQTPLRCTVIRLHDGTLWVHAPLAPTDEFFELVESCGSGNRESVAHVVVPTYALEHKVFVKDALQRWPNAQLWTSPEQFSFPFAVPEELIFGKAVSGVLGSSDSNSYDSKSIPPWSNEIEYATLEAGTFNIGGKPTTLYETAFFHKASKSLIVTDAVAKIPKSVPQLNDPEQLLLISKRSTSDAMPSDTPQARLDGWEKTALLVSYFFPEHEELDPKKSRRRYMDGRVARQL